MEESPENYIVENQGLVNQRDLLRLSIQTSENTEAIRQVQSVLMDQHKLLLEHDSKLAEKQWCLSPRTFCEQTLKCLTSKIPIRALAWQYN